MKHLELALSKFSIDYSIDDVKNYKYVNYNLDKKNNKVKQNSIIQYI